MPFSNYFLFNFRWGHLITMSLGSLFFSMIDVDVLVWVTYLN